MSCTDRKIDYLRRQIPRFDCVPGCHDCCGPVTASSQELALKVQQQPTLALRTFAIS